MKRKWGVLLIVWTVVMLNIRTWDMTYSEKLTDPVVWVFLAIILGSYFRLVRR